MKKILFTLALMAMPLTAFGEEAQTVVDFNGELVDQNASPLSGVLPLEFRVYADSKSKKVIATEKHFVSVVDGTYSVTLGEQSKIKTNAGTLYVSVYLDGKELMRQEVSVAKQLVASNPKTTTTDAAGGSNGDSFKLECPKGYVVTGIEGTTKGGSIEGLKLICSQAVQLN